MRIPELIKQLKAMPEKMEGFNSEGELVVLDTHKLADELKKSLRNCDVGTAAHQREVAELKSKMNDVVCENEALRDACGTCGAKLEVAELERKVAELRECLKMAVVNARIARTCCAFGRECDNCGQSCDARKWNKVIEATKGGKQ